MNLTKFSCGCAQETLMFFFLKLDIIMYAILYKESDKWRKKILYMCS